MRPSEDIPKILAAKEGLYSHAEVSLVWSDFEGIQRLTRGLLTFHSSDPGNRDITLDYGPLILERRRLSAEEGFEFIDKVTTGELVSNIFSGSIPKLGYGLPQWAHGSLYGLPPPIGSTRLFGWPYASFLLSLPDNMANVVPRGPIVNTRLPLISDSLQFADDFQGMSLRQFQAIPGIGVFLPDYRARFVKATIDDDNVKASFELGSLKQGDLMFRGAIDGVELQKPLLVDQAKFEVCVVPDSPVGERIEVFMLDTRTDQLVDWIQLLDTATEFPKEVEFASPQDQLQRLVRLGEGETQEFKQEVGDGDRLVQSVVAFANSKGGTVFVGVDDEGRPHHVDLKGNMETIERKIRADCDPYVPVEIHPAVLCDIPILLVKVPLGEDGPYVHRKSGRVYVRGGRTNFAATSEEIKRLANERSLRK